MMKTVNKKLGVIILLTLLSLPFNATAQKQELRYITDILYVPLRSGPSNEYRIVTTRLKSGDKLVVIDREQNEKWLKVVTESGVEGWVPSQYLIDRPSARSRLSQTSAKLAELEKQNAELRIENQALSGTNQSLNQEASSASSDKQKMQRELQEIKLLAADSINLEKRYRQLLENHELLQTHNEALAVENDKLKSDQSLNYMFYGAGLIFCGVFLAVVLPPILPKRRYSEWK